MIRLDEMETDEIDQIIDRAASDDIDEIIYRS